MKTLYRNLIVILIVALIFPLAESTFAGNKDRSGQAGATELLINPWARSSGWASANMSRVRGLEAIWGNVAGTAFTPKTQLIFSNTQWLKGTGTNIMSFGISQRVGDAGALTLAVMSMSFGDIDIRTVDNPDESQGTYSPNMMNIAIGYSKATRLFGGFLMIKVIFIQKLQVLQLVWKSELRHLLLLPMMLLIT